MSGTDSLKIVLLANKEQSILGSCALKRGLLGLAKRCFPFQRHQQVIYSQCQCGSNHKALTGKVCHGMQISRVALCRPQGV